MSRPSRSSAATIRTSPACTTFSRSFRPGLWNTVPVMMSWWIRPATPTPAAPVSHSR